MHKIKYTPKSLLELIIFNVRWLLIPFYLKLIYTLILLLYIFVIEKELPNENLIATLEDLDIVMIANLIKMIITGSYNSFIAKDHGYKNENISSGSLKIKMGTSLIGVSSIHLLQEFVNKEPLDSIMWKKIIIHGCFIVGGFMLAFIDHIHVKTENIEHKIELDEEEHEEHQKANGQIKELHH